MSDGHAALDLEHDHFRAIEQISLTARRRLDALRVLDALRRYGPISRASLAKRSRLSPPSPARVVAPIGATCRRLLEGAAPHGPLQDIGIGAPGPDVWHTRLLHTDRRDDHR